MWINRITDDITYGKHKITLTVRGETGMDHFTEIVLYRRLYKAVTGNEYKSSLWLTPEGQAIEKLASMINRTESIEGLPGKWATIDSDDKVLKAAYGLLAILPRTVVKQWCDLMDEANNPPGDPDTAPPDKLTDDQKKADTSKTSETNLETA